MKTFYLLTTIVVLSFLAGCAQSDLVQRNHELKYQISNLMKENNHLQNENHRCQRISEERLNANQSLNKEQNKLKKVVRVIIDNQYNFLRDMMGRGELYDYVGYPLVEAKKYESSNHCLIDPGKPVPSSGALMGVQGDFSGKCKFNVLLLRKFEKNKYSIYYRSKYFNVENKGIHKFTFEAPINVSKGDLIGYNFDGDINVYYYNDKTGSMGYINDIKGRMVDLAKLHGKSDNLIFSLRSAGLLDE